MSPIPIGNGTQHVQPNVRPVTNGHHEVEEVETLIIGAGPVSNFSLWKVYIDAESLQDRLGSGDPATTDWSTVSDNGLVESAGWTR